MLLRGLQEAVALPVRPEPGQGLPEPQARLQRQGDRSGGGSKPR